MKLEDLMAYDFIFGEDDDFDDLIDHIVNFKGHLNEKMVVELCNVNGFFKRSDFSDKQWRRLQKACETRQIILGD